MAFRNIHVVLSANASSLRSQLAIAGREVDRFSKKAKQAHEGVISTSKLLAAGAAAVGLVVAGGLAVMAKSALDFEVRMRNVNSISMLSERNLKALSREVLNLSRNLPQSANTLAEGLYDVASSGFQGAEGLTVLRASAEAASAGMSDTATAAKAITAVLNAYGREASDAQDVSDVLFQTVNVGVLTFSELANNVGDVIGAAAAAKVGIDEVGSALAAMTLAGISAAESATSLNRLIQSIIQPSEALALALQGLGYESGAQALEMDGLRGVMEKLRVATGGNIASLLQLFPEIRAVRGALALMAAEGENYRKTAEAITDAEGRQGATRRALNEQMKAVSNQLKVFGNQARAAAIEAGTRLLPMVVALMDRVQELARWGLPGARQAIQALTPFFRSLRDIGLDVIEIAKGLIEAARPLAAALGAVAGGAVIGALQFLAGILKEITGFLADNQALVNGLALVWGLRMVPAILASVKAFGALALDKVAVGLFAAAGGVDRLTSSFTLLNGVVAAAAIGLFAALQAMTENQARAEAIGQKLKDAAKTNIVDEQADAYARASNRVRSAQEKLAKAQADLMRTINPIRYAQLSKEIDRYRREVEQATNAQDAISRSNRRLERNLEAIAEATGLTTDQVADLATRMGVDLTGAFAKSAEGRAQVIDQFSRMRSEIGLTGEALQNVGALDIDQMTALAEAIKEVRDATDKAFQASTDLFSAFDAGLHGRTTQDVESAREDLTEAQKDLDRVKRDLDRDRADEEARLARTRKDNPEDAGRIQEDIDRNRADAAERLAAAQERVAGATQRVKDAEAQVTSDPDQIRRFYEKQIELTEQFASDLQTAVQKGVDPQFIARALQAGPEQAAPILQAITTDHSGRLVQMVNESEKTLREINSRVVEFARLTTLAVTSNTDQMARDLSTAMKIAAENMAQGGKTTAEAVARAIGVPTEEVKRVAQNYGITIADSINAGISSRLAVPVQQADGTFRVPGTNVQMQEAGGIQANIAAAPTVIYGERSTGSEAFVPRKGNRDRSLSTLSVAASWYGHRVVPMAAGGVLHTVTDRPVSKADRFVTDRATVTREVLREHVVHMARGGVIQQVRRANDAMYRADRQRAQAASPSMVLTAPAGEPIDYDRLAKAVQSGRPATSSVQVTMPLQVTELPTDGQLELAGRRLSWLLAGQGG